MKWCHIADEMVSYRGYTITSTIVPIKTTTKVLKKFSYFLGGIPNPLSCCFFFSFFFKISKIHPKILNFYSKPL